MERNEKNRTYQAPKSTPAKLEFERARLVATARLLMNVDETETVNTAETDAPGGEMYFEF